MCPRSRSFWQEGFEGFYVSIEVGGGVVKQGMVLLQKVFNGPTGWQLK
jgi:hypothetical protein